VLGFGLLVCVCVCVCVCGCVRVRVGGFVVFVVRVVGLFRGALCERPTTQSCFVCYQSKISMFLHVLISVCVCVCVCVC